MTTNLLIELNGHACRCGAVKTPGNSFCARCYYRLPKPMRNALYQGVGQGYEEAYATAVGRLRLIEARYD